MENNDFNRIFENIIMPWFFSKPIFFKLFCTYTLKENPNISTPFRSGRRIIEYNPRILEQNELSFLRNELLLELERILLKHPFRRPKDTPDFDKALWYEASTMTITQSRVSFYGLESFQSIEYYYKKLCQLQKEDEESDETSDSSFPTASTDDKQNIGEASGFFIPEDSEENSENEESNETVEKSKGDEEDSNSSAIPINQKEQNEPEENNEQPYELWDCEEEDTESEASEFITSFIKENSTNFGDTPAFLQNMILIQQKAQIPGFIKLLEYFKGIREKGDRQLTRMRPSRRFGYNQMGSTRKPVPGRILIGVDVSGSISDVLLEHFYSAIGNVFDRSIKYIDVFQFDCELKTKKPVIFKKRKELLITGRGGTSFQPIFDYAIRNQNTYDGLIIFTDGFAPEPVIHHKLKTKVLWVIDCKNSYENVYKRLNKTGLVTVLKEAH